jgi:hypothetical protein
VEAGASFRGFEGVLAKDGKSPFYIHGDSELRGPTGTLLSGKGMRNLAASPDGKLLALCQGNDVIILATHGRVTRKISMANVNELEWGPRLIAGIGPDLWNIPLDGGAPQKLESPGNRQAGFSLHPDGTQIAVTAGRLASEVRELKFDRK